jgi:hypothetical protein
MILLNGADLDFSELDVESSHNARRSKYWYKFHVSPEWFASQIQELQKGGYQEFEKADNIDLPFDVFEETEWGKPLWYSSMLLPDKRYSIYYDEDSQVLTLVVFYNN